MLQNTSLDLMLGLSKERQWGNGQLVLDYMTTHLSHRASWNSTMMLYWWSTSSMSTNCCSLPPFQDTSTLELWNSYITKNQLCSLNTSSKSTSCTDNEDSVLSMHSSMGNSNHYAGISQRWEYNSIQCPTMNMSLKSNAKSEPSKNEHKRSTAPCHSVKSCIA